MREKSSSGSARGGVQFSVRFAQAPAISRTATSGLDRLIVSATFYRADIRFPESFMLAPSLAPNANALISDQGPKPRRPSSACWMAPITPWSRKGFGWWALFTLLG